MGNMETGDASWEELGISNYFLFGKVMRDGELCKGLLQRILSDLVAALKDLNIPDDIILQKIQEKFKLSMEEAEKYL